MSSRSHYCLALWLKESRNIFESKVQRNMAFAYASFPQIIPAKLQPAFRMYWFSEEGNEAIWIPLCLLMVQGFCRVFRSGDFVCASFPAIAYDGRRDRSFSGSLVRFPEEGEDRCRHLGIVRSGCTDHSLYNRGHTVRPHYPTGAFPQWSALGEVK
jgi:hypothetical protein